MTAPTVSVIMNCLNGERYLRQAIESVFAQTVDDWEIVFWDNASTDRTPEIAREYEPKLRYFRSEETVPLYAARNLALERCQGRYVAFLDCDDVWLPDKLEAQLPLLEENSELGFVYSDSVFFDGGREYRNFSVNEPVRGMIFDDLLARYFLDIETVVVPRRVFDELEEAFDDSLQLTGDQDLFLRIAHDHPADYVARPLSKWRIHEGNWSLTRKELFPGEQKRILGKLRRRFPDVETTHREALEQFEAAVARKEALVEWERGQGGEARRALQGHLRPGWKNPLIYLATFFPYGIVQRLREQAGRLRKHGA